MALGFRLQPSLLPSSGSQTPVSAISVLRSLAKAVESCSPIRTSRRGLRRLATGQLPSAMETRPAVRGARPWHRNRPRNRTWTRGRSTRASSTSTTSTATAASPRREFLNRAAAMTIGGVSALWMAQALLPRYAEAQTISFTDPRMRGTYVEYPSPGGTSGEMRGLPRAAGRGRAVSGGADHPREPRPEPAHRGRRPPRRGGRVPRPRAGRPVAGGRLPRQRRRRAASCSAASIPTSSTRT